MLNIDWLLDKKADARYAHFLYSADGELDPIASYIAPLPAQDRPVVLNSCHRLQIAKSDRSS